MDKFAFDQVFLKSLYVKALSDTFYKNTQDISSSVFINPGLWAYSWI